MAADSSLARLPASAVEFFAVFSRFEYALKRSGLLKPGEEAEADWERFANERLGKAFFEEARKSASATTLLTSPPKTQIVKDGQLDWRPVDAARSVADLFGSVRRLRNNLFHGGKFASGYVAEPSRDEQLLAEAL